MVKTIKNRKLKPLSCLAKMNGWNLTLVKSTLSDLFSLELRTNADKFIICHSAFGDSMECVVVDVIHKIRNIIRHVSSEQWLYDSNFKKICHNCFAFSDVDDLEIQLVLAGMLNDIDYEANLMKLDDNLPPFQKSSDFETFSVK